MKELTTLRNYFQFRAAKGANVGHVLQSIDAIENQLNLLAMNQPVEANQNAVELVAKLLVRFQPRLDYELDGLTRFDLLFECIDYCQSQIEYTETNFDTRDAEVLNAALLLQDVARANAISLINSNRLDL